MYMTLQLNKGNEDDLQRAVYKLEHVVKQFSLEVPKTKVMEFQKHIVRSTLDLWAGCGTCNCEVASVTKRTLT